MIYIGLDQSSKVVGYAIMNDDNLIDYGVYNTPETKDVMMRVSCILDFLDSLVTKHTKDSEYIIAFEDTQESRMNVNTFQLLTKVLGALEYWAFHNNHNYKVCHVSSWRNHAEVKGKRREEKKANAIRIVKEKFNIDALEDAAEAILICDYLRGLRA